MPLVLRSYFYHSANEAKPQLPSLKTANSTIRGIVFFYACETRPSLMRDSERVSENKVEEFFVIQRKGFGNQVLKPLIDADSLLDRS